MCIIVVVGPHVLGKEERVGWELLSAVAHKKGQNKRIHVIFPFSFAWRDRKAMPVGTTRHRAAA